MIAPVVVVLALLGAPAHLASFCSVDGVSESSGYEWRVERVAAEVDSASEIVRVRAIRADSAGHTITFEPIEWLRGRPAAADSIVLPGVAVETDDYNDLPVPYQMVRPSGRRGSCFTQEYRLGGQYLLLFKSGGPAPNSLFWWPLGPVNEQLRGDNDTWLTWVRGRVARRSSSK